MLEIRPERESYTFSLARGQVPISLSEHSSSVKGEPHSNTVSRLCPKTMLLQRSACHSCLNLSDTVKLTFETTSHNVSLGFFFFLTCKQEWLQRVTQSETKCGLNKDRGIQKESKSKAIYTKRNISRMLKEH